MQKLPRRSCDGIKFLNQNQNQNQSEQSNIKADAKLKLGDTIQNQGQELFIKIQKETNSIDLKQSTLHECKVASEEEQKQEITTNIISTGIQNSRIITSANNTINKSFLQQQLAFVFEAANHLLLTNDKPLYRVIARAIEESEIIKTNFYTKAITNRI